MMNRMEPKHGMGSNVGSWLVCAPPKLYLDSL